MRWGFGDSPEPGPASGPAGLARRRPALPLRTAGLRTYGLTDLGRHGVRGPRVRAEALAVGQQPVRGHQVRGLRPLGRSPRSRSPGPGSPGLGPSRLVLGRSGPGAFWPLPVAAGPAAPRGGSRCSQPRSSTPTRNRHLPPPLYDECTSDRPPLPDAELARPYGGREALRSSQWGPGIYRSPARKEDSSRSLP